ncbi:MAG: SurA N-terminal domain-containing protein, partial [Candidatus Latescibacteria bacterium]|nr:SurA N-terminal domain-containing protein [Candidatus Latescibacterota bacterium]
MLNLLRSKTFVKTVLWIVVLGFVGWLGYDVGYGGPSRDQDFYVGEINGTQLDYPTYQERRNLELQRRRDPENPDALDEFAIDQDIWDRQVEEILMKEAIDDYGIQVSSQEVAIAFLEQPLPGLETADIFQTDGAFDASKYREWYKNLDQAEFYRLTSQTYGRGMTLSEYESLISQQLSQNKLRQRITSAAVVGNADVRRQYAQNNERVKVEAAYVTLSKVLDDTVAITNEEIRGYYEANLDDYAQESRASLAYAALSKAPTTRDVARIKHDVDYVLAQLRDGADFGDLARAYSDHTATRGDGGFLGEMTEGALPSEQDKAVFALKAGEFTEALETPDGWEIYKVDSLSGIGGVDTALVRHILFRTDVAGPATLDSLRANA